MFLAEEVHRPAPAMRGPGLLPEELGHYRVRLDTLGQGVAVLPVGAVDIVLRAEGRDRADDGRLLADVEVAEAADLGRLVHLGRLLLETADQQHLPVELQKDRFIRQRVLRWAGGGAVFGLTGGSWNGNGRERCKIASIVSIDE